MHSGWWKLDVNISIIIVHHLTTSPTSPPHHLTTSPPHPTTTSPLTITHLLSPTHHHPLIITHSPSPTHHHPLIITHSSSPTHHHLLIITYSLSPTHHHPLIITHSPSPTHHHLLIITTTIITTNSSEHSQHSSPLTPLHQLTTTPTHPLTTPPHHQQQSCLWTFYQRHCQVLLHLTRGCQHHFLAFQQIDRTSYRSDYLFIILSSRWAVCAACPV